MADKEISMLPATDGVTDDTLIPVYQPGATEPAQHMNGKQFAEFAVQRVRENMGNGLTDAEKTLMLSLFKAAAYTENVSAKVTQLEALWSGSGDDSGDSGDDNTDSGGSEGGGDSGGNEVQTYTVTNNLTGVTSDNAAVSVTAGSGYTATLTVEDGCILNSLVITMGGEDITDSVYGEGYILITNVTGNIVITAVAEELKEISMSELASQYISVYSDNGSTQLTKAYFDYFATDNKTETDANVIVELTNSGDSACSGDAYIGCDKVKCAIKKTISLAAGDSVRYEYTVKGGCALGVCVPNASAITVRAYGVFDVYQPTAEYAVNSKQVTTAKVYSDGTTGTQLHSANYQYTVYTTEIFAEDTDLIVTLVGGESNIIFTGTDWYFGSVDPSALATVYYGVMKGGSNASLKPGQVQKYTYTVKAGYAFAIVYVTADLKTSMVYVERA